MTAPLPPRLRVVIDEFALRAALDPGPLVSAVEARASRHWVDGEGLWEVVVPASGGERATVWVLPATMRTAPGTAPRFPLRGDGVEVHLFVDGRSPAARAFVDGKDVAELWVQGPRMDAAVVGSRSSIGRDAGDAAPSDDAESRYAGALGGPSVLERLRSCSLAVVGVSRLGSRFAARAARAGVQRLILVDSDRVEPHNLDQMVARREDVGRPKVDAVAQAIRREAPDVEVVAVAAPLESRRALEALKQARVVVTAPDRNEPRILAAAFASAYARVHLDLGTQVLDAAPASFAAGLDVRLVLPGEACLLCVGGVDLDRLLDSAGGLRARAGSLPSLNGLAVAQAWLLLERLAAGSLRRSAWVRIEIDAEGMPSVRRPVFRARGADCPICGRAERTTSFETMLARR